MLQVNVTGNCGHEVSEGETDRLENAYNGFEEHRRHFLKEFSAASVRDAFKNVLADFVR